MTEQWAEHLQLDKEDDGGRWVLTYAPPEVAVVRRLRIAVGGPADWYSFSAEVQIDGAAPMVLSTFDVAPIELFPPRTARYESGAAEAWNPADEPDFLKIPVEYQTMFALMVFAWGRLSSGVVPAPAWLTVH